jgi:hypothetical protein
MNPTCVYEPLEDGSRDRRGDAVSDRPGDLSAIPPFNKLGYCAFPSMEFDKGPDSETVLRCLGAPPPTPGCTRLRAHSLIASSSSGRPSVVSWAEI